MKAFTFKRGLHLPAGKYLARHKKIEYYLPKGELVFPLFPGAGPRCEALVNKGDRVLLGQKIAEYRGDVLTPVHSSVSGTVKNIAPMATLSGSKVMSIIIENDGLYEKHDSLKPRDRYDNLSGKELINIVREAGVTGMDEAISLSGTGASHSNWKKVDCVIVNGVQCEPYVNSSYHIMMEESERVVNGLKIALRIFAEAKGCIAIDSSRMDAVEAVKKAAANEPNIEIKVLKAKYPRCSDGQLVYEASGRTAPAGALPVQAGCIVCGVETIVDIERAVLKGRPVMRRIVAVNGGAAAEPKVFNVRTGTSFRELIEAAGGLNGGAAKVISGGPMTGTAAGSIDIPVLKDTSTILCLTAKEAGVQEEQGCIRCGRCVKACPVNLIPSTLNSLAGRKEYEMFEKNHGMECIECGSCSYVCPSKRHLAQSFRTVKRTILANKDK